jgi:hypothetical protein
VPLYEDARRKTQDARRKTQDARRKTQDARRKTQDARRKTQDARRKTQVLSLTAILSLFGACESGESFVEANDLNRLDDDALEPEDRALQVSQANGEVCESKDEVGENGAPLCEDREFRHPMRGAAFADGKVPHFDIRNSEHGRRFAVQERLIQAEEGAETEKFSGVVELEVRKLTAKERQENETEKEPVSASLVKAEKIDGKLQKYLDDLRLQASDARVEVDIILGRTTPEPVQVAFARAVAKGEVRTESEALSARAKIIEERTRKIKDNNRGILARAQQLGIEVVSECKHVDCLTVAGPAEALAALLEHPRVNRAELPSEFSDDSIDNDWLDEIHDRQQFEDAGYDGESLSITTTAAVVESGPFNAEHLGFRENSGTATRLRGTIDCVPSTCNESPNWGPSADAMHATAVAGVLAGDFDDSQSATYNTEALQNERSASNPESRLYLYRGRGSSSFGRTVSHMVNVSPSPDVANLSWSNEEDDTACLGQTIPARQVNQLYESGILPIKTAGNEEDPEGFGSTTNCTIGDPGSAIGAFVVGNLEDDDASLCAAQASPIRECGSQNCGSSWGGNATQGNSRTIVDLAAFGQQNNRMCGDSNLANCNFGGTSSAAPTVAGAALNYIDQFGAQLSEGIRDPGHLHAHMLLMGDRGHRSGTTESTRTSGFSNRYGAGRMRMRMINDAGRDAPGYFTSGEVCVEQGEVITIRPNGTSAFNTATDVAKVVLWFYDRRHEDGGLIDDIDVRMRGHTTGGSLVWTASSISSFDEKEMAYRNTNVGGNVVSFEISGFRVTADDEGCGTNSMRVFYAFYAEDSARNDSDGPSWNATTCVGQPLL